MIAHSTGFGIDTSIKREGIKLVLLVKSTLKEMMQSCKYFPHVSKMAILGPRALLLRILYSFTFIFTHRDMYYITFMKES